MNANAKSHTHCQVAQKGNYTSQNLSISMSLPTPCRLKENNESPTRCILHFACEQF